MNKIFWKIYLWLMVAILVLGSIGEASMPSGKLALFIFDGILLAGTCIGLYGFIYKKMFLTSGFWKHFLYLNIAYTLIYLLYALFPTAPYIEQLSIITYTNDNLLLNAFIGVVFSLPSYYAFYKLSQGGYFEPKEDLKINKPFKWGMAQIALWGYSTVISAIFFLSTFLPSSDSGEGSGSADVSQSLYGVAIVLPVLLFWLWVVFTYKRYKWNWWRITLVLNAVLYSGMMVLGLLFADFLSEFSEGTEVASSDYDIIATLQFLILFVALTVFGRDQFHTPKKVKPTPPPPIETA